MLFICILCEFIKPHSIAVDKLFIFHGPSLYETYSELPNKGTITYTHKPRKLRYFGGKLKVTATNKTQLARLNICSDWGKSHIE